MSRKALSIVSSALILFFLAVTGISAWLLGTVQGAEWLLKVISRQAGAEIEFSRIDGSLWKEIRLEGIQVHWQQGYAKGDKILFEWHPLMALTGNVAINKLYGSNIVIQDNRPEDNKPPDLSWPKAKGLLAQLDAWVDQLKIDGLDYHRLKKTHFKVTRVSSIVIWQGGMVSLKDFELKTPSLDFRGNVEAGFLNPALITNLIASVPEPIQGIDRFSLNARLMQGRGREQLNGPVTISGLGGSEQIITLSADIGLTKTALNINKLQVKQTDRQGTLSGKGEIDFNHTIPKLQGTLGIEGLDLSPEMKMATDISGTLAISGNIEDYKGRFTLSNKGKQQYKADLSGSFKGNKEKIQVQIARGIILGGRIEGQIRSSWHNGISLSGELQARNMNPAILSPNWNGVVNLNLATQLTKPPKGNLKGDLSGHILESRLRGRALTGEIQASMQEGSLLISKFFLNGNGFDIHVHGDFQKHLSFSANIRDLSGLIPQTEGHLYAKGWVNWNKKVFSGSVNAHGNNIAFDQLHIKNAKIEADLSEREGSAVRIYSDIKGLSYKELQFRSAIFQIDGKPESHTIKLSLHSPDLELHTELKGIYHKRTWKGRINDLSYRDTVGRLHMQSPADLALSKDHFSLSPLVIQGKQDETLLVKSTISMHPLAGFIQADWNKLNLSRGNQWTKAAVITGQTSGKMRVIWDKGDLRGIDMVHTGAGTFTAHKQTIAVNEFQVQLSWDSNGLLASINIEIDGGGILKTRVASSSPVGFKVPEQGEIDANFREFNLIMFNPFLPDTIEMTGKSSGRVQSKWAKKDLLFLKGRINAYGTVTLNGNQMQVNKASLNLDKNEKKLTSILDLELTGGGVVNGQFHVAMPPRLAFPEEGDIDMRWENIPLSTFQAWLPNGLEVKSILSGQVKGKLIPGGKIELTGESFSNAGTITQRTEKGRLSADLRKAEVSWIWNGETLKGDFILGLTQYGKAAGHFALPIPARIPPDFNRTAPINISIDADIQEKGLLTSLFPGLVHESHGALELKSTVEGTWEKPQFTGNFQLKDAGAYFPDAGIKLKDIALQGHFRRDLIVIDTFTAKSGDGRIEGKANLTMNNWYISRYEGNISGKRFRTVHLPELQVETSPQLKFEGSPAKLSVKGEIEIPGLFVYGSQTSATVKPSDDVVILDADEKPEKKLSFALDIQVHVALGKKVFIKTEGIDAQLGGDVYLTAKNLDEINGKGLIHVIKGDYRKYGINLDIQRGRLLFNGLVTRPSLDVVALRKIGDVKAGVTVTGTPQSPKVRLYSEPPMPDNDILAYMVLGHPLGDNKGQAITVLEAAGHLLSTGESVVLQERMKRTIGIDVLDVDSGSGDLSRSMLTIGKYLTPQLFISYGQSLFGEGGLFRLRHSLSKHWEVQTESGIETGGDLFYKMDFK